MGVTETTRPASMVQFNVRWCPSTRHPHRAFGEGCPKMVMAYRSGPSRTPPPRSSCGSRRRMSAAVLAPESDNPQSRRASAAAKATAFSRRSASSRPSRTRGKNVQSVRDSSSKDFWADKRCASESAAKNDSACCRISAATGVITSFDGVASTSTNEASHITAAPQTPLHMFNSLGMILKGLSYDTARA